MLFTLKIYKNNSNKDRQNSDEIRDEMSPRGAVANVLDCYTVINEFEIK